MKILTESKACLTAGVLLASVSLHMGAKELSKPLSAEEGKALSRTANYMMHYDDADVRKPFAKAISSVELVINKAPVLTNSLYLLQRDIARVSETNMQECARLLKMNGCLIQGASERYGTNSNNLAVSSVLGLGALISFAGAGIFSRMYKTNPN